MGYEIFFFTLYFVIIAVIVLGVVSCHVFLGMIAFCLKPSEQKNRYGTVEVSL